MAAHRRADRRHRDDRRADPHPRRPARPRRLPRGRRCARALLHDPRHLQRHHSHARVRAAAPGRRRGPRRHGGRLRRALDRVRRRPPGHGPVGHGRRERHRPRRDPHRRRRRARGSRGAAPVGVIAFDCAGRRAVLGADGLRREMDVLAEHLPGVPLGGFYTYGEYARVAGSRGVHNATLVLLAFA
ncbi:FIST C-terminal domain-containing protein [Cellulomonas sp. ATA003]|uniref:FIST C-terminal domain-containing protein n=1 Tax=Cellulomonas sp. ATA003 TaxID=3073064 RepID=UPI0037BEAAB9